MVKTDFIIALFVYYVNIFSLRFMYFFYILKNPHPRPTSFTIEKGTDFCPFLIDLFC